MITEAFKLLWLTSMYSSPFLIVYAVYNWFKVRKIEKINNDLRVEIRSILNKYDNENKIGK